MADSLNLPDTGTTFTNIKGPVGLPTVQNAGSFKLNIPSDVSQPAMETPPVQTQAETPEYQEPSPTGFFKNLGGDFVNIVKGIGHILYKVPEILVRGGSEWVSYFQGNRHSIGKDFSGEGMDVIGQGIHENVKNIVKAAAESYAEYKNPILKAYNHPLDVMLDALTVADLGTSAIGSYANQASKTASALGKVDEAIRWSKIAENAKKGAIGQFLKPIAESPVLQAAQKIPWVDKAIQGLHLDAPSRELAGWMNEGSKLREVAKDADYRAIFTSAERTDPGAAEKIIRVAMGLEPESILNTPSMKAHSEFLQKLSAESTAQKIERGGLTAAQAEGSTYAYFRNNLTRIEIGKLQQGGYLLPKDVTGMNYLLGSPQADASTARVIDFMDKRGSLGKILNADEIQALKEAKNPRGFILNKYAPLQDAKAVAEAGGYKPFYLPAIHEQHLDVANAFIGKEFRAQKAAWMKARTGAEGSLMDANVSAVVMQKQLRDYQYINDLFRRIKGASWAKEVSDDIRNGTYVPGKNTVLWSADHSYMPFMKDVFETQNRVIRNAKRITEAGEITDDVLKRSIMDSLQPDVEARLRTQLQTRGANTTVYEIPKSTGELLTRSVSQISPLAKFIFDGPADLLRVSALHMDPFWYMQHLFGNTILNMMSGINPFSYFRAGGKSFAKIVPDKLKNALSSALNTSFTQSERTARGLTGLPPFRQLGKVVEAVNDWSRSAHFMDRLTKEGVRQRLLTTAEAMFASDEVLAQKLKPLFEQATLRGTAIPDVVLGLKDVSPVRDAIASTNKWLFDYNNLHPVERNIIRRIVPFWTFMKNINMLMLRLPVDSPLMSRAFGQIGEIDRKQLAHTAINAMDDENLPDWLEGHVPMGTDKDGNFVFVSIKGLNPFNSFGNVFNPQKLAASTNPIIKASLEYFSGRDMWSKKNLQSDEPIFDYSGRAYRVRIEDGKTTLVRDVPGEGWVSRFVSQFGQVQLLRNIINPNVSDKGGNPVSTPFMDNHGNWQYPTNVLDTALAFGGIHVRRVDSTSIENQELAKRVKFIKDSAKHIRDAPPEYRSFVLESLKRAAQGEFQEER